MLAISLAFAMAVGAAEEKPYKSTAVFSGTHSQIKKSRFDVIEDAAAWRKLWSEHRGTDRSFIETDQDFEVDFDTSHVVCVFCGHTSIRPRNMGTVVVRGTLHVRYSLGAEALMIAQFRPEPFLDQPHDSKAEDICGYMFVVVPKEKMLVVVEEYFRVVGHASRINGNPPRNSFEWVARFPTPPKKK